MAGCRGGMMTRGRTPSAAARLRVLLVLCAVPVALQAQARPATRIQIDVSDPRPLAEAVSAFERATGVIVTYEDPEWSDADSVDVTDQVRKDPTATRRVYVPRGGPLTSSADWRATDESTERVLQGLIDAYAAARYPGTFEVRQTSSVFHVVPVSPGSPALDARITVQFASASLMEVVEAVLSETSRLTGWNLHIGTVPTNLFFQTQVSLDVETETVRQALVRVLRQAALPLSWQLFCDPKGRECALNVHAVRKG